MNNSFIAKTALITGASSGLGEQMSKCLLKAGARVILMARSLDRLTSIAKEFKFESLDAIILLLASNEASSYVTGSCFTIGGLSWGGK
jgi:NADP-dependent 3-hydroxy acid dehydrogenase YdfG